MKIVGCDLHTRDRQIARLDTETGSCWSAVWSMTAAKQEPSMLS